MRVLLVAFLVLAAMPAADAGTTIVALRVEPSPKLEVGVPARLVVEVAVDCTEARELEFALAADQPGLTLTGPKWIPVVPQDCFPGNVRAVLFNVTASELAPGEQDIAIGVRVTSVRLPGPGVAEPDAATAGTTVRVALHGLDAATAPATPDARGAPAGTAGLLAVVLGLAARSRCLSGSPACRP